MAIDLALTDVERDGDEEGMNESADSLVRLRSLELFAGPGGLALGVHLAGFQHLALIEREPFAAQTLKSNSASLLHIDEDRVFQQDAKDVDYRPFEDQVDLLAAGPPCQPFSRAGKSRGADDPRNMFPLLLDVIPKVRPRALLIENVTGLVHAPFWAYFEYILMRLRFPFHRPKRDEGWQDHFARLSRVRPTSVSANERYMVDFQLVNAANFGIPQCRERVLIHAFRCDLGVDNFRLMPTHSKEALLREQWVTSSYWRRHGVQPYVFLGPRDQAKAAQQAIAFSHVQVYMPWRTVRDAIGDLPPATPRGEQEVFVNHVQHPGARSYSGHTGSLMDMPAKTLKAGDHGTPGGENIVRLPGTDAVRYFTTREAARLQTFPDEWHFDGTWKACIQQLGNAVPVDLGRLFASEIRKHLETAKAREGSVARVLLSAGPDRQKEALG